MKQRRCEANTKTVKRCKVGYSQIKFVVVNRITGAEVKDVLLDKDGQIGQIFIHGAEGYGSVVTVRKHPDAKDLDIKLIN